MTETDEMDRKLAELLPWYANGTVEGEDRRAVERFLDRSDGARRDLDFLRQLRETVRQTAEDQPSPGALGLARLRRSVAAEQQWRLGVPSVWRLAAIAAAALVVLQSAAMIGMAWRDETTSTATAPSTADLQIRFKGGATAGAIGESLSAAGLSIVEGPSALGVYRLALALPPDDPAARDAALARAMDVLKARPDVVLDLVREGP